MNTADLLVRPTHRKHRGVLAATALATVLLLPLTGAGSAIAAPHGPSLASTIAVLAAPSAPVAVGKLDV